MPAAKSIALGPLSAKVQTAKHYAPERIVFETPSRITNSGVREPLKVAGVLWTTPARERSGEAAQLPRVGAGC